MPVPPLANSLNTSLAAAATLAAGGRSPTAGEQSAVAGGGAARGRGGETPENVQGSAPPVAAATVSVEVRLSSSGRVRAAAAEVRDAARAVQPATTPNAVQRTGEALRGEASRLVNAINNASRVNAEATGLGAGPAAVPRADPTPTQQGTGAPAIAAGPDLPVPASLAASPANTEPAVAATDRPAAVRQAASTDRTVVDAPLPPSPPVVVASPAISSSAETRAGSVATPDESVALSQVGITLGQDGYVAFDAVRFDLAVREDQAAVEQTLGQLGQRIEASVEPRLSTEEGAASASRLASAGLDQAGDRAARFEEVQREVQQRIANQQQVNQTNNPFLVGGIAAYRGVFAL